MAIHQFHQGTLPRASLSGNPIYSLSGKQPFAEVAARAFENPFEGLSMGWFDCILSDFDTIEMQTPEESLLSPDRFAFF